MPHSSPDVDHLLQNKKTDHRVAGFAIGSPETFPWYDKFDDGRFKRPYVAPGSLPPHSVEIYSVLGLALDLLYGDTLLPESLSSFFNVIIIIA